MKPTQAAVLLETMWDKAPEGLMITEVVTDNRNVTKNSVFVAIKGNRVDGHDFAKQALQQGAALVVVQHAVPQVPAEKTILVADPLDAMITMGANYRRQFSPIILGVTGSVGKTTTKEFCAAVFSSFGNTVKTQGNQNNEIGLPNTLFRLDETVQYAVVEMGMQALGEIHKLSMAAAPSAAIITKIGTAHMQSLGSVENILRAKMEICDGLATGAPLVLNGDDAMLVKAVPPGGVKAVYAGIENEDCDVRARKIESGDDGQRFEIVDRQFGNFLVYVPAIGRHNVYNALLAYTAGTRLGLDAQHVAAALSHYVTTGLRQNIVKWGGVTLVEDCYNASPESMQAAIGTLREMQVEGNRIVVFGDMWELGAQTQQAHREIGASCARQNVNALVTVGELAALAAEEAAALGVETHACQTNQEAAGWMNKLAQSGDAVLVKASNGMHFEEILAAYKAANPE